MKKKQNWLTYAIILAFVGVAGYFGYMYWKDQQNQNTAPSQNPEPMPTGGTGGGGTTSGGGGTTNTTSEGIFQTSKGWKKDSYVYVEKEDGNNFAYQVFPGDTVNLSIGVKLNELYSTNWAGWNYLGDATGRLFKKGNLIYVEFLDQSNKVTYVVNCQVVENFNGNKNCS